MIRLAARMVVRQTRDGRAFFFGVLARHDGLQLPADGGDLLLVLKCESTADAQRPCPETSNRSPEDILEAGIPALMVGDNDSVSGLTRIEARIERRGNKT